MSKRQKRFKTSPIGMSFGGKVDAWGGCFECGERWDGPQVPAEHLHHFYYRGGDALLVVDMPL